MALCEVVVDDVVAGGVTLLDGGVVAVDGYAWFGACAVTMLELESVEDDGAADGSAGAFIALLGAGVVLCAVCELVEPPDDASAEPLWPLDWA